MWDCNEHFFFQTTLRLKRRTVDSSADIWAHKCSIGLWGFEQVGDWLVVSHGYWFPIKPAKPKQCTISFFLMSFVNTNWRSQWLLITNAAAKQNRKVPAFSTVTEVKRWPYILTCTLVGCLTSLFTPVLIDEYHVVRKLEVSQFFPTIPASSSNVQFRTPPKR